MFQQLSKQSKIIFGEISLLRYVVVTVSFYSFYLLRCFSCVAVDFSFVAAAVDITVIFCYPLSCTPVPSRSSSNHKDSNIIIKSSNHKDKIININSIIILTLSFDEYCEYCVKNIVYCMHTLLDRIGQENILKGLQFCLVSTGKSELQQGNRWSCSGHHWAYQHVYNMNCIWLSTLLNHRLVLTSVKCCY